ncbi:unnamed protein product [Aureobasidium vineae]|uniref:Uncharacterized protein n=1 Tax=Aureobasidium vineae TaxID=2773715 RepID=A0A9N8JPW2_9PEZI|nr:unnamed protein product [Aureobasidium vineae]
MQNIKIYVPRTDSGLATKDPNEAGNLNGSHEPHSWEDYKRKLFLEWLDGQPDAHNDIWGFSSTSCTPVGLSRSSSVVHIANEADEINRKHMK